MTGGTSGIGFEAAKVLAGAGYEIKVFGGTNKGENHPYAEVMYGDLFDLDNPFKQFTSEIMNGFYSNNVAGLVLNAAINIDTIEDENERIEKSNNQFAFMANILDLITEDCGNDDPVRNFTLYYVSSISVLMDQARDGKLSKRSPYVAMKNEQLDLLLKKKDELLKKDINIVVLYPGAISTKMMSHLGETQEKADENAVRLANMQGKKCNIIQDKIFTAEEVGKFMADDLLDSISDRVGFKTVELYNHEQLKLKSMVWSSC
jgi:NAD(P)-dependent dehydrogenase (short-subunit alcohol dehydrogenase family)